jgi:predicted transposase YbfD/YdcC
VLSAFATDTALVLAHIDIAEKSNEIPAVQIAYRTRAGRRAIVTMDALHCQKIAAPLARMSPGTGEWATAIK